jgi:hypothetical protein
LIQLNEKNGKVYLDDVQIENFSNCGSVIRNFQVIPEKQLVEEDFNASEFYVNPKAQAKGVYQIYNDYYFSNRYD